LGNPDGHDPVRIKADEAGPEGTLANASQAFRHDNLEVTQAGAPGFVSKTSSLCVGHRPYRSSGGYPLKAGSDDERCPDCHGTDLEVVTHSNKGIAQIILGFSNSLIAGSAENGSFYNIASGVKKRHKLVFSKDVKNGGVSDDGTTQQVTITLAKPFKRKVQVMVHGGIMATNGLSSHGDFQAVVMETTACPDASPRSEGLLPTSPFRRTRRLPSVCDRRALPLDAPGSAVTPCQEETWCIPPEADVEFVAWMEEPL